MPRQIVLAALLATTGSVAGLAAPSLVRRSAALTSPRLAAVRMESRWPELEKADKAVFEDMEPYKGRVSWGFSDAAEKTNGRVAMMAFTILYLQEAFVGTGILTQYGLPYDEGAVVPAYSGFIPGPVGLVLAVLVTGAAGFGLIKLDNKLSGVEGIRGFKGENK